jgi:antitoxin component of RelBE/YafQ-DinJ toxin-antitoxin module
MKLPAKFVVKVEENTRVKDAAKRAREWCGKFVSGIVWLSTIFPNASYVFRGHADASWTLESSLFRAKTPSSLKRLELEEESLLKQISQDFWFNREFGFVPALGPKEQTYERTVSVLQHHGVPTRLLDVTADPLVGLYFAVIGSVVVTDMDGVDGAVIFVRKVASSHGLPIHVISAPQVSERVTAQRARFIAPVVNAAPGATKQGIVPFDFFNIDVSNGSGTDFDNLVDKFLSGNFSGRPPSKAPNFLMFRIPCHLKPTCRQVLRSLGISASTLFPGSEGFKREFSGF